MEASGQVEIEGFLPNSVLRLAGFKVAEAEIAFDTAFVQFLKGKFADCHVTVSPVAVQRA